MTDRSDISPIAAIESDETLVVARNVSTRYLAIGIEAVLGLVVLPFNIAHLGTSAYGLWMLTASITAYFSVLDMGYSGALVKFVAQYRAKRDHAALNEILSTTFVMFAMFGVVMYLVAIVIAVFLGRFFHLSPEQVHTGRIVLLIISLNVAAGTAFNVFGGVINGFQRYDLNNVVGAASSLVTALVNVAVLAAGFGLVELVAATTIVRLVTYLIYRVNAYRVFPGLQIRFSSFRRERLREMTFFSVYMLLIDCANKMNYSLDAIVIGGVFGMSAVAVWTVSQRVAEMTQRLTNQLNDVLFPTVVDNSAADRTNRLQTIFIQGTRLSLGTVIPIGGAIILMAAPLVQAWVGPGFSDSVVVLRLLSLVVIIRVGNATAATVLKGSGEHKLVAFTNIGAALVNLGLGIALVRPLGLAGVAIATLIPIALASALVLFPAGCRRVQMSLWRALVEAVWPATWPAAVMTAFVLTTRDLIPVTLVAVAAEMSAACAIYAGVFVFFGISASQRQLYLSKATELVRRRAVRHAVSEGA